MASAGETDKSNSQHVRLQIRHSCVCNRQYILMSHQTEPENYSPVVYSILANLDVEGNRKLTFPIDRFQMHVIVDNGLVFSCITYKTNHHYMPFMFLETFQRKFHEIPSLVSRSVHARENEFDRDFGPVLTTIVYEFNIGRGDKISQLQVQVDDVKRIMLDNVEKVMQRGEDLDNLLTKTESLESSVRVTVGYSHTDIPVLLHDANDHTLANIAPTFANKGGRFPSENQGSRHEGKVQEFENVARDWWDPRGGPNRGHSAHLWNHPHVRGRATLTGALSPPSSTCKRTSYSDWGSVPTLIHIIGTIGFSGLIIIIIQRSHLCGSSGTPSSIPADISELLPRPRVSSPLLYPPCPSALGPSCSGSSNSSTLLFVLNFLISSCYILTASQEPPHLFLLHSHFLSGTSSSLLPPIYLDRSSSMSRFHSRISLIIKFASLEA
uniref:Vesicle-associated membrane protein 7 n=1 Tax=Timema monikensis TaxID=170555 RepID=A0A7R9HSK4_9NEOP|nr:unnamed protein product [Timema monikensis]